MAKKKKKTTDAAEVLRRRYVGEDPDRKASVEAERVNTYVARMIYDLRKQAELTQEELADLLDTTQSVISRLENADYEGHSLSMLNRIAKALNQRLTVTMTARDPDVSSMESVFPLVMELLRRDRGLTVDQLADELELDRAEILAMERYVGYRPSPFVLYKLSEFYDIPQRALAALAGAIREASREVREEASRFAARSESFSKLTDEEKTVLDEFVRVLRAEGDDEPARS